MFGKLRMVILVLFLAATISFAADYSQEYVVDSWAKVTRTVSVNEIPTCYSQILTGACTANLGTTPESYDGIMTTVLVSIENIGGADRKDVVLMENLAFVPEGAKITFDTAYSSSSGRMATFTLGEIASGEEKTISYSFNARASETQISAITMPIIEVPPAKAIVSVPSVSELGESVTIKVKSESGEGLPYVEVRVDFPNGKAKSVVTDANGLASFSPDAVGFYTFATEGFDSKVVSSEIVSKKGALAPVAAVVAEDDSGGIVGNIFSFLPSLGILFGIAVIVLVLYGLFASRREGFQEQEDSGAETYWQAKPDAASPGSSQAPEDATGYSQKFSFPQAPEREDRMNDMAKGLVESRKRRMQPGPDEKGDAVPDDEAKGIAGEAGAEAKMMGIKKELGKFPIKGEETSIFQESSSLNETGGSGLPKDEVNHELDELGKDTDGGSGKDGDSGEIEKTIAELEAIREKLRKRRAQMSVGKKPEKKNDVNDDELDSDDDMDDETYAGAGEYTEGVSEEEMPEEPEEPAEKDKKPAPKKRLEMRRPKAQARPKGKGKAAKKKKRK